MATSPSYTEGQWEIVSTQDHAAAPNDDILWRNVLDGAQVLWEMSGAEVLSATSLPSPGPSYTAQAVGDFDGDGKADVWLRDQGTGDNQLLLSTTGTLTATTSVGGQWRVSASTELTGDGNDDIVWFDPASSLFASWSMNGATVGFSFAGPSGYAGNDVLHAAFNGSALDSFDSLWFDASANSYNITSYDAGARTVTDTFTVTPGRQFQNTTDLDGDGGADFAFIDTVGVGFGDAELVFSNNVSEVGRIDWDASDFNDLQLVAASDFDGDGNGEILMRDGITGDVSALNPVPGNDASTTLFGSDGQDLIDGRSGNDRIFALGGDDYVLGGDNNDTIAGGEGDDTIEGNFDDDFIEGNAGNDFLEGNSGNDVLAGGAGDDLLSAGSDMDILSGGAGDDHLLGSSSSGSFDIMRGGIGDDTLAGVGGRTILEGGSGNDHLYGGTSLDRMWGDSGDDVLIGGLSLDWLDGGSGNDVLIGTDIGGSSGQSDTLTGGSGRDFFVLGNEDLSYYAGSGRAVITDFSASSDKILLNGLSSAYDFIQNGPDVEIRFDGTVNLVADVLNATVANVTANAIYLG